jgi:hypothetical protein
MYIGDIFHRTANPRSECNSNLEYCDTCNKLFSLFRISAIVFVHCADIHILFSESITTSVLLCRERHDLLRKNNGQHTNNIDVSCVQTIGLKHAKGLFVLLETNFFNESSFIIYI